jgi:hypothetical protein
LCNTLDKYISKNVFESNEYKSYDRSYINSSLKFNDGLHRYKGLTICLFDSTNNYPIDINLLNHRSERKGVLDNIDNISKCSILIFDRGYEGTDFFNKINKKQLFVCRIKECTYKSLCDTYNLPAITTDFKLNHNSCIIRYLKYTINNTNYYIATNLLNETKYPTNCFADIYHKRWKIEEFFKTIKKNTTFSIMHELKFESFIKTIYCISFVAKLTYLIANICNRSDNSHIVNKSSLIEGIYDEFLPRLFYHNKINKKFSIRFMKIFIKIYVNIIKTSLNISHPRIAKKACYLWNLKKYQKGTNVS